MSIEEEGVIKSVAGLEVAMRNVVDLLKEMQSDMKAFQHDVRQNYMTTATADERFKSLGERIERVESGVTEKTARLESTLKTMDQDVKDKFVAYELRRRENTPRILSYILGIIVIGGAVVGVLSWYIHSLLLIK